MEMNNGLRFFFIKRQLCSVIVFISISIVVVLP